MKALTPYFYGFILPSFFTFFGEINEKQGRNIKR